MLYLDKTERVKAVIGPYHWSLVSENVLIELTFEINTNKTRPGNQVVPGANYIQRTTLDNRIIVCSFVCFG